MEKILPEILNGPHRLVLSESFCADPRLPVVVAIPAGVKNDNTPRKIIFVISFIEAFGQPLSFDTSIEGDTVYFRITNYRVTAMVGTIKPWEFTVNGVNLFVLFNVSSIGDSLISINLSIYTKGETL